MIDAKSNEALASMASSPVKVNVGGSEIEVKEITLPRALALLKLAKNVKSEGNADAQIVGAIAEALQTNLCLALDLITGQKIPQAQAEQFTLRETVSLAEAFLKANDIPALIDSFSAVVNELKGTMLARLKAQDQK